MASITLRMVVSVVLLAACPSFAADPTAPVREVVEATAKNWADDGNGGEDVFSEDRLARLFSAEFVALFRAASKNPPFGLADGETTGFPFDYDPIAGGQDGCPFKDIRIEDDGDGQVTALFNNRACFGDGPEYKQDTVVIFHVDEEKGRAVIDDVYHVVNFETGPSLKQQMKDIAAQ